MDIFQFRNQVVRGYTQYVESFIKLRDPILAEFVRQEFDNQYYWPEPLIQLNPNFQSGGTLAHAVQTGLLHPVCETIFQSLPHLHQHQLEAVQLAQAQQNYVLTTGTGSGKSIAYILPIINHVLRNGSGKGVRAIIVYPMNALANSQVEELEKFLGKDPAGRLVTFGLYTGQENLEQKEKLIQQPPDILLTNYMMLELILTRSKEEKLVSSAKGLQFLVFDELHTYRGRQGADISLLIRRIKDRLECPDVLCIGTSATMSSSADPFERKAEVAKIASTLFDTQITGKQVVGETLREVTMDTNFNLQTWRNALENVPDDFEGFIQDPICHWIEHHLGIGWNEKAQIFERQIPKQLTELAKELADFIIKFYPNLHSSMTEQERIGICTIAIQQRLQKGHALKNPQTKRSVFAFRLHQFISKAGTLYAPIAEDRKEHLSLKGQLFSPKKQTVTQSSAQNLTQISTQTSTQTPIRLYPLEFCRNCGQEYYSVRIQKDPQSSLEQILARSPFGRQEAQEGDGYLYISQFDPTTRVWPTDEDEWWERLPDHWIELSAKGIPRVKSSYRPYVPQAIRVDSQGYISDALGIAGYAALFIPAVKGSKSSGSKTKNQNLKNQSAKNQNSDPDIKEAGFKFCLHCSISYSGPMGKIGKLSTLGSEGRSTATTLLNMSAVQALRHSDLEGDAHKILSFSDNRQDASLQSGHFNDFIFVCLLRSAIYRAVHLAGSSGITFGHLAQKVFEAMQLELADFAAELDLGRRAKENTLSQIKNLLGYFIFADQKESSKITLPNLETSGLLKVDFPGLEEFCQDASVWARTGVLWQQLEPKKRLDACQTLLAWMRGKLAIHVSYLQKNFHEDLDKNMFLINLESMWYISTEEIHKLERDIVISLQPKSSKNWNDGTISLTGHSRFARYLKNHIFKQDLTQNLKREHLGELIAELLQALEGEFVQKHEGGYQIRADALHFLDAQGEVPAYDVLRLEREDPLERPQANPFFVELYQRPSSDFLRLKSAEHTAQIDSAERKNREEQFRKAELPVLFCSPTMELGVDIATLNVVSMRNVPPTPANYAQRSGRAGRSGQPALVLTYATVGNSHDQYFFDRPKQMVAGVVSPPRLELNNENLIRAHVQAIWLAETGVTLENTLAKVLNLEVAGFPLGESLQQAFAHPLVLPRALKRAQNVLARLERSDTLQKAAWYHPDWLSETLKAASEHFDRACDRWRELLCAAESQRRSSQDILDDFSKRGTAWDEATRLITEAQKQRSLLLAEDSTEFSEFSPYRYLASEGFLPGYNFARLPINAYLPAQRLGRHAKESYLSRARFMAISEFGPDAIIYHNGAKYKVHKVMMDTRGTEGHVPLTLAQRCSVCGYLHQGTTQEIKDFCENCHERLKPQDSHSNMFRMRNVSTIRRERISSNEEERHRIGFELRTALRYATRKGKLQKEAVLLEGKHCQLELIYGDSTTLWRINYGWRNRKNKQELGFYFDTRKAEWVSKKTIDAAEENPETLLGHHLKIIPYVEDTRNTLLVIPRGGVVGKTVLLSLLTALRRAICKVYQLEEVELGVEALPSEQDIHSLLFFEASEGGAGVLQQLVNDSSAFGRVIQAAWELCHFVNEHTENEHTENQHTENEHTENESCVAACYDCLMSYGNQNIHEHLDRRTLKEILSDLRHSQFIRVSEQDQSNNTPQTHPNSQPNPSSHLERLYAACDSALERKFLDFLQAHTLKLPDASQETVAGIYVRPDFRFGTYGMVFIDGPVHLLRDIALRDQGKREALQDAGYDVIVFGENPSDWLEVVRGHVRVFGTPVPTKIPFDPEGEFE